MEIRVGWVQSPAGRCVVKNHPSWDRLYTRHPAMERAHHYATRSPKVRIAFKIFFLNIFRTLITLICSLLVALVAEFLLLVLERLYTITEAKILPPATQGDWRCTYLISVRNMFPHLRKNLESNMCVRAGGRARVCVMYVYINVRV